MTDKISMIELFSGVGAQERAIRQLGIPYEVINTCDCDPNAVLSYAVMRWDLEKEMETFEFPSQDKMIEELQAKNLGYDFQKGKHGITKRTPLTKLKQYYIADKLSSNLGDISKVDKLPYADVVTYSFPCFVPGTMVLTDNGSKNIEDIQEGDMVLTHTNQYQKVVKPMRNYCNSYVYKINAMCSDPILTTEEHPFYVRKRYWQYSTDCRYESGASKGKEKKQRLFSQPEWIKAKDLTKDCYVGVAINQKAEVPKWEGITLHWSDGRKDRHSNRISKCIENEDFWWLIGRYLGDGWLRSGGGIIICCAPSETNEIITVLNRLNWGYNVVNEGSVNKIHVSFKEINAFCSQFGVGAANKRLTQDVINLPVNLLKAFLDGYWSADGCVIDGKHSATSVSRELIYGLTQCVAKVYHRPCSVSKYIRPKQTTIEGRVVNQKDTYLIRFATESHKQDKAFYEDGYIWCPIKDISTEEYNGYVYNMEVENDNSYVVQNIIVHNCTDLSVAGKGEGMVNKCDICGHSWPIDFSNAEEALICPNCGATVSSSTRSGLLGQVQRLLGVAKENNTLPKYLLLENVKNLVGKKFKPQFDAWVKWLDSIGYNTYYQVLNAKNYGIPQNRERVFAVSIRKDVDTNGFTFPEPIPLTTRLKDILERNVDEKYYLPNDRIEKILNSSFTQEKKRIQITDIRDILLARDWKDPKCVPVVEPKIVQNPHGFNKGSIQEECPSITSSYFQENNYVVEPIVYDDYNSRISADQEAINTLTCNCGASAERNGVKIIEPVIVEDFYQSREPRVYSEVAPTLRSERTGLKVADEIEYPCSTRGKQVASAIRASIYKQGARNLEENVVNGLGYEGVIEKEEPKIRWRIRKLTPLECWRLMNFTDKDCIRAAQYISPSAQYKQAGNSIVVACLIAIFSSLFIEDGYKAEVWTKYQLHYWD